MQLSNYTKVIRVLNAVAAGISNQNGSVVDTQGFDAVRFIVAVGAITATAVTSIKVQQGAASNGSDAADIAGSGLAITAGGTDDNSVWIVDVYRPTARYLRVVVLRGTANAVIDGAFAELYSGKTLPETVDATVHGQTKLVEPALGTP